MQELPMSAQELDPTNPIVIAMQQKRILEEMEDVKDRTRSLEEAVQEVLALLKNAPKCPSPGKCGEIEQRVDSLEARIKPIEEIVQKGKGVAWLGRIMWVIATSGILGWLFIAWRAISKA